MKIKRFYDNFKKKEVPPIEELIKLEHKSRQMALALESKVEYYRSQADMYLEMLLELDSYEKEE